MSYNECVKAISIGIEMAKKACVKEMWLTHYSPSLVRPEPYMEEVRKIFATASAGKDGKSTTLLFEEE